MPIQLEFKNLIYLVSIFIGFFSGFLALWYGYKKYRPNLLFGFSHLALSYGVFTVFLINSGAYVSFPALYRTGNIAGLLFAPITYLYIRQIIKDKPLNWLDSLHLIPAIVFIIDFFPILFLTSTSEKLILIQSEISNPAIFTEFNQTRFFTSNLYSWFRTLLIFVYWFLSLRLVFQFKKTEIKKSNEFSKQWIKWIQFYLIAWMLLFLPYFLFSRFGDRQFGFDLLYFSASLTVLINSIVIFFFPSILYGFVLSTTSSKKVIKEDSTDTSQFLTPEKVEMISEKLKKTMEEEKLYLKKGLSIADLSKEIDIPSYLLTHYLNRELGISFSDFINEMRVEECCKKIKSGELQQVTLEAIGLSCGFNNRNSFITAFKKFKGMSPSSFSKSI